MALALSVLLAGCGAPPWAPQPPEPSRRVTVFAAASLAGGFTELGRRFEASHPGIRVAFSFGGSGSLVDQLAEGARADVLATADEATMRRAFEAALVPDLGEVFAVSTLVLIVPADNPGRVTGLHTLTGRRLVICAPTVPCGAAALRLAKSVGITLAPVSEEASVSDVRGKVASGEADAGLVYLTEAQAAGDRVLTISVARSEDPPNRYPITSSGPAAASAKRSAYPSMAELSKAGTLIRAVTGAARVRPIASVTATVSAAVGVEISASSSAAYCSTLSRSRISASRRAAAGPRWCGRTARRGRPAAPAGSRRRR